VNYYKRHLGDYAKKAGHLSALEHGVYTLILDAYYDRELAPTKIEAIRWSRARSADEIAAVEVVLSEFFHERDGRFIQNRVEAEFVKAGEQALKNEANGKLGGRPRKPNCKQLKTETKPSGLISETETKDNPLIHQSTNPEKPPIVPKEPGTASAASVKKQASEAAVLAAYHAALPKCQRVSVMNPKRQKRIAAAEKLARIVCVDQGWQYDPGDFWESYFAECSHDPWMRGEVQNPKNPAWRQNVDVLLAEDRFAGIMDSAIATMRNSP
jgi:uncharacterized protein YdaU (DUF1376 family)